MWNERPPEQLSWHQDNAKQSFTLITASLERPDDAIIDVGGVTHPSPVTCSATGSLT